MMAKPTSEELKNLTHEQKVAKYPEKIGLDKEYAQSSFNYISYTNKYEISCNSWLLS